LIFKDYCPTIEISGVVIWHDIRTIEIDKVVVGRFCDGRNGRSIESRFMRKRGTKFGLVN